MWISNSARVHKWAKLNSKKAGVKNVFIHLPVGKEIILTKRAAAFPAVMCGYVATHDEVVVADSSQRIKLVEGKAAPGFSGAELMLCFVVVPLRFGVAVHADRGLKLFGLMIGCGPCSS